MSPHFVPALVAAAGVLFIAALPSPGRQQAERGKKYALLVGVNEYRHRDLGALRYAENDVEKLAGILTTSGGFARLRVLTGARGQKAASDAPTADNIRQALAEILRERGKHDTVLIALSGHGVQLEVEDPDGKGKDKTFPYFCPADADFLGLSYRNGKSKKMIHLDELFEDLGKSGAGTKLVLLDACRNELKAKGATRSVDASRVTIPEGVGALFSCARGQKAWEAEKLRHGVFFHFVLEGLRGKAKNDEGAVTWEDLGIYVKRQVSREVGRLVGGGAKQSPHSMGSLVGESPVLVRLGKGSDNVEPPKAKKRLLVITESKGFVHEVVKRGKDGSPSVVEKALTNLGRVSGDFEAVCSQDSRKEITAENLKTFDAVFFYTSGTLPLSDTQKADLIAFVKNGKGFAGCHSAADTFYQWAEYGKLLGGYFDGHPWHQKVRVTVEDAKHPATKHLGESFEITDEIYQFKAPYDRKTLRVLMRLDTRGIKAVGKRKDSDYALAWVREYGKGRVFYTALGHRPEVWKDERFVKHLHGGLRYALGLEKADASPSEK